MTALRKITGLTLAAATRPMLSLLRGKPCNLSREELRNFRLCFSQYGEDLAVLRWVEALNPPKIYVDAGCFDPSLCSNTLLLHKAGWRGVNVDLDPIKIQRFRKSRPLDDSVVAALSDTVAEMVIHHYPEPTTDCLKNVNSNEALSVIGQSPVRTETVQTTTLNNVLKNSLVGDGEIGYLNVDCEGHDMSVLRGCDLSRYRPYIISIEALDDDYGKEIKSHLNVCGYDMKEVIYKTLLFVRRDALAAAE
jgi:FkbM family methyltransferase